MSSDAIRLYVVTDSAERACLGLFGFSLRTAQVEASWCRFIDQPDDLTSIPIKAPVLSCWFFEGWLIETRWREIRSQREFDTDFGNHVERIADWLNRRAAAEAAHIAAYLAEHSEGASPRAADCTVVYPQAFDAPPASALPNTQPRAARWS